MPCAINLPLAARSHARGMFAAQIPIAKPAARPTERPSRDFVPWRFSDAGCRSAWLDRRTPASENLRRTGLMHRSKTNSYSVTSSARESNVGGTAKPRSLGSLASSGATRICVRSRGPLPRNQSALARGWGYHAVHQACVPLRRRCSFNCGVRNPRSCAIGGAVAGPAGSIAGFGRCGWCSRHAVPQRVERVCAIRQWAAADSRESPWRWRCHRRGRGGA